MYKKAEKNSFLFRYEWYEMLKVLPIEDRWNFIDCLCRHEIYGEVIEKSDLNNNPMMYPYYLTAQNFLDNNKIIYEKNSYINSIKGSAQFKASGKSLSDYLMMLEKECQNDSKDEMPGESTATEEDVADVNLPFH